MNTTPIQTIIIATFLLTLVFTGLSFLWFWVDTPFIGKTECSQTTGTESRFVFGQNSSENIFYKPIGSCTISPPKDLSPAHSAFINLATISFGVFLISSGYAYIQKKRAAPEKPKELG